MTVKFYSDHINWGHGFLLNFLAVQNHEIPADPKPDPIEIGTCGNDYVVAGKQELNMYSPGWPDYYQSNLD